MPSLLARVPSATVFIIGDELAGDGSYRRALQARASALGVAANVRFTGHRTDIASAIAAMDVVVVPSIEESASYALVEALLMGKGVVASAVGGLPETVRNGETGLLVPPGDPAALSDAVAGLLADPGARREWAGADACCACAVSTSTPPRPRSRRCTSGASPGQRPDITRAIGHLDWPGAPTSRAATALPKALSLCHHRAGQRDDRNRKG